MALSGITVVCILMLNVFLTQSEWIEMSHAYRENMNGATDPFEISLAHYGATGRAPFAISYKMRLSEHSGTHIDAPVHFSKGRPTVDELLPENLIGHAIVINITEQALKNPDYEVSVDDFTNWEKEHGAIPKGTIVFLLTGRGKYWGNVMKYMGLVGNISGDYHFPGIGKDAAQWIVDSGKIKGVGLDVRSLDRGQSKDFFAHRILLGNELFGLENVKNIEKLPTRGAIVYVSPMKIKNGSGGPTRIFAQTDPVAIEVLIKRPVLCFCFRLSLQFCSCNNGK